MASNENAQDKKITSSNQVNNRFNNSSQNQNDIEKLNNELISYEIQNSELEMKVTDLENQLADSKEYLFRYQKSLNDIKASIGFKIIRFYGSNIENIKKAKTTFTFSREFIKEYGFSAFLHQVKLKIKKGEFSIATSSEQSSNPKKPSIFSLLPPTNNQIKLKQNTVNRFEQRINYPDSSPKQNFEKSYKVSVVIPTNSDENTLGYLFSKIMSQNGMKGLEIILVNSGKHDLSSLQKLSNVKLIYISPEEFNHGTTRNLGASKAEGDFVLFQTDDAIPANKNLYYELCKELDENPQCGCVSPKQIPRSDADLISKYIISNHIKFIKKHSTKIKPNSFDNLSNEQKRAVSQIDDVCACYRKTVFSKYQYSHIQFGEDIELGVRLVKDGFEISNLFTNGVIHSHNRDALYWLKRGFTERRILNQLFGTEFSKFKSEYKISSEEELLQVLLAIYKSIRLSIDSLKAYEFTSIHETFSEIRKNAQKYFLIDGKPNSSDSSLDYIFKKIFNGFAGKKTKKILLLQSFLIGLKGIENFMKETYPSTKNVEAELYTGIYKFFGLFMGEILGRYIFYSKKYYLETKRLTEIEKILKSGV